MGSLSLRSRELSGKEQICDFLSCAFWQPRLGSLGWNTESRASCPSSLFVGLDSSELKYKQDPIPLLFKFGRLRCSRYHVIYLVTLHSHCVRIGKAIGRSNALIPTSPWLSTTEACFSLALHILHESRRGLLPTQFCRLLTSGPEAALFRS